MNRINWGRVLVGGVLWAVVYNVLGASAWYLFLKREWTAALQALGQPFQPTAGFIAFFLFLTLVAGIIALWLYAAIRPRYGPGPKTALWAGLALWLIGYLLPAIVWLTLLHRLPTRLLVGASAAALVEDVVATVVGAWPYKE